MEELFAPLCHRAPERCGWELTFLCARCLGIYVGAVVGAAAVLAARAASWGRLRPAALWVLASAVLATPVEVLLERTGTLAGSNTLRLGLGLALGTALVLAMGGTWLRPNRPETAPGWLLVPSFLDALGMAVIGSVQRWGGTPARIVPVIAMLGVCALAIGILSVLVRGVRRSPQGP